MIELAQDFKKAATTQPLEFIALIGELTLPLLQALQFTATAKGIVKYTATLTGYGNVVYLKHGSEYLTVYAHLSKFAKGLKSGDKVSKGQLIGYVGSTGQSTGPHLHYELRINGIHQDAEKVKLPKQSFVPSNKMSEFQARAKQVLIDLGV